MCPSQTPLQLFCNLLKKSRIKNSKCFKNPIENFEIWRVLRSCAWAGTRDEHVDTYVTLLPDGVTSQIQAGRLLIACAWEL